MENGIGLNPEELVLYFYANKNALKTCMVEIAKDDDYNLSIRLTENEGRPLIYVCFDEKVLERTQLHDFCEEKELRELYAKYGFYDNAEKVDYNEVIDERESKLEGAWEDFLSVVFEDEPEIMYRTEYQEDITSMLEDVLKIIGVDYQFPVYRPVMVETTSGETLVEYPYEELSDF